MTPSHNGKAITGPVIDVESSLDLVNSAESASDESNCTDVEAARLGYRLLLDSLNKFSVLSLSTLALLLATGNSAVLLGPPCKIAPMQLLIVLGKLILRFVVLDTH